MLVTLNIAQQGDSPNTDSRNERSDKRKDDDGGKISKEVFLIQGLKSMSEEERDRLYLLQLVPRVQDDRRQQ